MAGQEINDTYWRSQLYVSLWPLWLILYIPTFLVLSLDNPPEPAYLLSFLPLLIFITGVIVAHLGLVLDGRAVSKSDEYKWRPLWVVYFGLSFLVGVFFVAPFYMIRRRQRTGRPNLGDVKRKISLRGLLIPWH